MDNIHYWNELRHQWWNCPIAWMLEGAPIELILKCYQVMTTYFFAWRTSSWLVSTDQLSYGGWIYSWVLFTDIIHFTLVVPRIKVLQFQNRWWATSGKLIYYKVLAVLVYSYVMLAMLVKEMEKQILCCSIGSCHSIGTLTQIRIADHVEIFSQAFPALVGDIPV